ncbi:MAG: peptidoglycan editing factor PgeF [Kiloniellales bacterium]
MLTSDALNTLAGIRHGFFTRLGGVSSGLYASHNCGYGSGDEPAKVRRNRAAAMRRLRLAAGALITADQVHGTAVAVVEEPWPHARAPVADGLVTRRPGLALGILTADCAPVLFADPAVGVIGAAHVGWRGALAGVLDETVAAMGRLGARTGGIVAAIGPCIGAGSYEVGPELQSAFIAEDPGSADLFLASGRDAHFLFDLPGYLARRLARLGLRAVEPMPGDTAADEARFFSHRRARLRGEPDYGRQLSAIALGG